MVLDTASLYFRAFYGVPDTRKSPQHPPTNAASGLLDMTARLIRDHSPGAVVACWDDDWRPQFRVDLLPSYKEHRVATGHEEQVPDALQEQIPLIEALLVAAGMPPVGVPGHEADDVIGTYATICSGPVDIVTGDRDLFQLVDDASGVRVLYTARGIRQLQIVDEAHVIEKYGVRPQQYADMATLRGDASDGLLGVAGIGEKTAASLLRSFDDLAGVRAAAVDASSSLAPGSGLRSLPPPTTWTGRRGLCASCVTFRCRRCRMPPRSPISNFSTRSVRSSESAVRWVDT